MVNALVLREQPFNELKNMINLFNKIVVFEVNFENDLESNRIEKNRFDIIFHELNYLQNLNLIENFLIRIIRYKIFKQVRKILKLGMV